MIRSRTLRRTIYRRQLQQQRDIGIDPKYRHGSRQHNAQIRPEWLQRCADWNERHPLPGQRRRVAL